MKSQLARRIFLIGILITSFLPASALALDPMRIGIRTGLPEEIQTVGEAAQYYADVIGYRLVTKYPAPAESGLIATETINPLARAAGIKPVEEAILALLRADCLLVIDHDHKLFSFESKKVSP